MIDSGCVTGYCNFGVLINKSGGNYLAVTLTTTVNVTVFCTTKSGLTYGTAVNINNGTSVNLSQLTATIDTGLDRTAVESDIGVISYITSANNSVVILRVGDTHTAAIYTAKIPFDILGIIYGMSNSCIVNDYLSTYIYALTLVVNGAVTACYGTNLTTAIHVTVNLNAISNSQSGALYITKFCPVYGNRSFTIQLNATSHTAGKYVTACGMRKRVVCIVTKLTFITNNSIAAYGNVNVTTAEAIGRTVVVIVIDLYGFAGIIKAVITHLTIAIYTFIIQAVTYRAKSATTVDRTEHCTAVDVQFYATTHITCSVGIAGISTSTAKYVTVNV